MMSRVKAWKHTRMPKLTRCVLLRPALQGLFNPLFPPFAGEKLTSRTCMFYLPLPNHCCDKPAFPVPTGAKPLGSVIISL